jgi:hypothetical protein
MQRMKLNTTPLTLTLLLILTSQIATTQATDTGSQDYTATEDTYVDTFRHTLTSGDEEVLWIARELKEALFMTGWNHKDVLLKFDLSTIPIDIQIISAKLHLYCVDFEGENVSFRSFHCSSNNWEENTLNHATYQLYVIDSIYETGSDITQVSSDQTWYMIDITDSIDDFIGGTLTEVLRIVSNHMKRYVKFSSKEGVHPPYLEVTYEKYATSLTCQPQQSNVIIGEGIAINGQLLPATSATLNIKYQTGDTILEKSVNTALDGTYLDSFIPTETGLWTLTAEYSGTEFQSAANTSVTFNVSASPSQPEEPTTPAIPGFPVEAIFISILLTGTLLLAQNRKHSINSISQLTRIV